MKLWPFRKSEDSGSVRWANLSSGDRSRVAHKIGGAVIDLMRRANFGKGYEAVSSPFTNSRRPSHIETKGEDGQLSLRGRHALVNMQRDMMRNSPTRVAQDQQIRVNVVGSVGGKLYASFPEGYAAAADEVVKYFNRKWFPQAEFTFRKNFNWLLKTCLTAQDTNGNVILVFDDGILSGGNGTGRIRGFEGDEIAPVAAAAFDKRFGEGFRQSAGFVYDKLGMFCGAFVSTKARGRMEFQEGEFATLRVDPTSDAIPNWIVLGDMRRFNQGRSVSPLTAAITCLIDLHEISASEAQAAKLNAHLLGQILSDSTAEEDVVSPFAVDEDGEDGAAASSKEYEFTTRELNSIGAHFDQMPPGLKVDLLDSKRPNPNMPAYIEFLTGTVGGTRGLARVYSTLRAQTSYTAYRGEQVITEASFEEARQDLEREVCDWAARCVISRAVKLGEIEAELPDGWEYMIAWNWPKMREVSEKDAQSALQLKLQNGVTSLKRELGPGEVEKIIAERAAEKKAFDEAGLVYPGEATASGQIKGDAVAPDKADDGENAKEEDKRDE